MASFMEVISQGDGYEFTADTIFEKVKDKVPKRSLKRTIAKQGVLFRKLKALHLIHQTQKVTTSSRNDSAGIQIWKVGRKPKEANVTIQKEPLGYV